MPQVALTTADVPEGATPAIGEFDPVADEMERWEKLSREVPASAWRRACARVAGRARAPRRPRQSANALPAPLLLSGVCAVL